MGGWGGVGWSGVGCRHGRNTTNGVARQKQGRREESTAADKSKDHQPEPSTWSRIIQGERFMTSGPPKDCTRVFPVKGAVDALCNPKTDVPRHVSVHAPHGVRLGGKPGDDLTQCLGPPSPACLQNKRAKGGTQRSHLGRGIQEKCACGSRLRRKHLPQTVRLR